MTKITVRGKVIKHSNGKQDVTRATLPKKFADQYELQTGDEIFFRVLLIQRGKNNETRTENKEN